MTPIVLIPGLACTAEMFAHQTAALWPLGPVTVASTLQGQTIADMAASILSAAPPRFALGGISMGGYLCFEILRQAPDNLWAREQLGHLELLYGDLARAEQIYLASVRVAPERAWHNLGVVRFLRGRYPEAAVAYRSALENDPGDVSSLLNLADTEVELGHREEAEALYRRALARLPLGDTPEPRSITWLQVLAAAEHLT